MWWLKLIGAYLFGTGLEQAAASLQRLRGNPAPLQPFSVPPVAAGTPIPVLYGTMPVRPIVAWVGGVASDPVYSYSNPFLHFIESVFTGPQRTLVGYSYHVTLQGVLCWGKTSAPINLLFDGKRLLTNEPPTQRIGVHPTDTSEQWITVATSDQDWFALESLHSGRLTAHYCIPYVFGQPGRGGGFGTRFDALGHPIGGGGVTFAIGSRQYGPDPVMQGLINPGGVSDPVNNVPGYSDLATVVYEDVTVGESQTPPAVDYIIWRLVNHPIPGLLEASYTTTRSIQYGSGPAWTILEMTQAAMLYDAMRSSRYGPGVPESRFDSAAWIATVTTLFSEGIYGSWLIGGDGRQLTLKDIRDEVEQVIDGQLVRNPETFQWRLTLNREEDYDTLPSFDERHIRTLDWHEAQPHEVINQVTVEFLNADKLWALDTVILSNDASIAEVGLKPTTIRFQSVTSRAVALKLCARELRRRSTPLARGKAYGTRVFWSAEPGNVFKLSNAKHKLSGLVVRIVAIDYGSPDNGEIQMDLVEDVFGHDNAVYSGAETRPVVTQASIIAPAITAVASSIVGSSNQFGQLAITLADPQHRVIEVAFNRQVGDGPASDWTVVASATPNTADPTFPYNATVTLGDLNGDYVTRVALPAVGTSAIAYRIRYIGTSLDDVQEIIGESPPFTAAHRVVAPGLSFIYSGADVIVTATAPDASSVKIAGSLAGTPTIADVRATGALSSSPFTKTFAQPAAGEILTVDALAYEGTTESELSAPLIIAAPAIVVVYPTWQFDDGGGVIATGATKCWLTLPAGTITGWKVQVSPAATATFDLWRNNGGHALPTVADSLGLSFGPVAHEIEEGVFGTPIVVADGDNIRVNVLTNDLAQFVTLTLTLKRT